MTFIITVVGKKKEVWYNLLSKSISEGIMELTIALAISILGAVLSVSNFVISRRDKAVRDTKENHQELIEYQLKELKDDVKTILSKLDRYEKDMNDLIDDKLSVHVKLYHNGG